MTKPDTSLLKELTVLFVDDEPATRDAMGRMLGFRFREVWLAENGQQGLERFHEFRPSIVITDIEMPVMNGIELLRRIKEEDPDSPVVVVTGFADEVHRAVGADAVLIKPVNRAMLVDTLMNLARGIAR